MRVPDYEVLLDATAVLRRIEEAIDERTKQRTPFIPALLPHRRMRVVLTFACGGEGSQNEMSVMTPKAETAKSCRARGCIGRVEFAESVRRTLREIAVQNLGKLHGNRECQNFSVATHSVFAAACRVDHREM